MHVNCTMSYKICYCYYGEEKIKRYRIEIASPVIQCCLEITISTAFGAGQIPLEMLHFTLTATIQVEHTKWNSEYKNKSTKETQNGVYGNVRQSFLSI